MRFAEVELQNSKELRATASEIAAPKRISCETSSKSESGRCENKALVRDFPQNLKFEDVQTKLSCEISVKI
jgi:hypothetical protein